MSWPKQLPQLTAEQESVRDDFMRYWHEVLPKRYGIVERFNHEYVVRARRSGRTLELGAGLGEHIRYENLADQQYSAVELRPEMAAAIEREFPDVEVVVGDCQERLPFPEGTFDRVVAVHVLEHLPNLPAALDEVHRLLRPGGMLAVVIPCEGGWAYTVARRISAQRLFEKRYRMRYDWFVASEHINLPHEIVPELEKRFSLVDRSWFPLRVPSVRLNLCVGLTLVKTS